MKKIYLYILNTDTGFAPNPFHKYCTLACCKPKIRKKAKVGEWVMGFTSAEHGKKNQHRKRKHLLYAMEVQEILDFDQYWTDKRFALKKPNRKGSFKERRGDNIYHKDTDGKWIQEDSFHDEKSIKKDTNHTSNVLVSKKFHYLGKNYKEAYKKLQLPDLYPEFANLNLGVGHRVLTLDKHPDLFKKLEKTINILEKNKIKLYGKPLDDIENDDEDPSPCQSHKENMKKTKLLAG